jgi:hypothetical protein
VPFVERVRMLKTLPCLVIPPESVLGAIVPVMHEVSFQQEEEILPGLPGYFGRL